LGNGRAIRYSFASISASAKAVTTITIAKKDILNAFETRMKIEI